MNETLYLGEDGVDRPAAEHRKHLLERIRHRIDAFDRHTGAT